MHKHPTLYVALLALWLPLAAQAQGAAPLSAAPVLADGAAVQPASGGPAELPSLAPPAAQGAYRSNPASPAQYAQVQLPAEIAMPQLLELVKNYSPSLQAERTQVAMAEADLMAARTLPNPSIAYTHKRDEKETTLSQDLPIFGQRGSRIVSAQSGIEAARAQLRVVYAQALQDAARDFMALLVSQEREKRWVEAKADLESAYRIVQGQVQAGARSQYDLTRLDVERASLDAQLAQAQADTQQASAEVAADVGAPQWRPRAAGSIVAHFPAVDFDAVWKQAQTRLPEVRAALAQQDFAEKQLTAEKRQAIPVPTAMVGHLNDRGVGGSTEWGVSVAIPLFDRNQGPISRAAAEAEGARLRSQATIIAAEGELRRAAEQLNKREQLAERFEKDGLSMVPRLRQMAQDSYTLGRGSILDLVDAIQAVAEKKNTYLDLLQDAMQAEVDLRVASGELGADLLE